MDYIALYHVPGETDHCFGGGQKLVGRVASFDGTLDEAKQYFAKQAFYGGDQNAKAEDYKPRYDGFRRKDAVMVVVAPFDESMKQPLDTILGEHNAVHRRRDAEELEKRERAQFARLKEKYES